MDYFLKLGQFLSSAVLKRMTSTTAQLKLIPENKHSSTVIMNTYTVAYIYILSSIITYTNSYTAVNRDMYIMLYPAY